MFEALLRLPRPRRITLFGYVILLFTGSVPLCLWMGLTIFVTHIYFPMDGRFFLKYAVDELSESGRTTVQATVLDQKTYPFNDSIKTIVKYSFLDRKRQEHVGISYAWSHEHSKGEKITVQYLTQHPWVSRVKEGSHLRTIESWEGNLIMPSLFMLFFVTYFLYCSMYVRRVAALLRRGDFAPITVIHGIDWSSWVTWRRVRVYFKHGERVEQCARIWLHSENRDALNQSRLVLYDPTRPSRALPESRFAGYRLRVDARGRITGVFSGEMLVSGICASLTLWMIYDMISSVVRGTL